MARKLKVPSEMREASKIKAVKPKKKRKPMTPEQKAAAVERLAKARAAKAPAVNKNVPAIFHDIPAEDPFSLASTKENLKHNQDYLKGIKTYKESKDAKERSEYAQISTYVDNLKKYISTGIYHDNRFGKTRGGEIQYHCVAIAYYKDGTPKRSVGTWYPDVGLWTIEMERGEE